MTALAVLAFCLKPTPPIAEPVTDTQEIAPNPFEAARLVAQPVTYTWDDDDDVIDEGPEVVPTPEPVLEPNPGIEPNPAALKSFTVDDVTTDGCWTEEQIREMAREEALKVATSVETTRLKMAQARSSGGGSTGMSSSGGSTGRVTLRAGGGSTGTLQTAARPQNVVTVPMSNGTYEGFAINPGETLYSVNGQPVATVSAPKPAAPTPRTAAATGTTSPGAKRSFFQRMRLGRYYTGADGCTYDSLTGKRVSCPAR